MKWWLHINALVIAKNRPKSRFLQTVNEMVAAHKNAVVIANIRKKNQPLVVPTSIGRLRIFDTETTRLGTWDRIVEIGAIAFSSWSSRRSSRSVSFEIVPVISYHFNSSISFRVSLASLPPRLTLRPRPLQEISCCRFRMTKLLQLCLVIKSDAHCFCCLCFLNCV